MSFHWSVLAFFCANELREYRFYSCGFVPARPRKPVIRRCRAEKRIKIEKQSINRGICVCALLATNS